MPWRAGSLVPRARPRLASSTARGYGTAHRALRKVVLREEPWCPGFPLGAHGAEKVRTTVMDHKLSQKMGGRTVRWNVQGLCAACNGAKAVRTEGARPR
jgi:hypothetical protein